MANTPWKEVPLPFVRTPQSAADLSYPAQLYRTPWIRALRSQDSVLAGRRQLLTVGTGGSLEWQAGDGPSGGVSQTQPDPATWRVVAVSQVSLSPGASLELRALALPSGGTQTLVTNPPPAPATYDAHGAQAAIRLVVALQTPGVAQSVTVERPIPESSLAADGAEVADDGAAWAGLQHLFVAGIKPKPNTLDKIAERSEGTTATLTLSYRGGARLVHASVCEVPDQHASSHDVGDTLGPSTAHDWPAELGMPHKIPQLKGADGATYDEPRFGTTRGMLVAERQTRRLGPVFWTWSSRTERLDEVTDTDPDPIEITSTSWVHWFEPGMSAWSEDSPGWDLCAAYCKTPNNLSTRLRGNAAALPVRLRVHARWTTNLGTKVGRVRIQSTPRSWVEMVIPEISTWAWYTTTAYLEANVTSRDAFAIVQPFGKVSAGTMQLRYCTGELAAL
jgi:hypothetical protein